MPSPRRPDSFYRARPLHRFVALASGLLLAFAAFGFGSWFSGAASWVDFYAGARSDVPGPIYPESSAGVKTLPRPCGTRFSTPPASCHGERDKGRGWSILVSSWPAL